MPEINLARPCTFTDETGQARVLAPGRHRDVPQAIADHWFVRAHFVPDGDAAQAPETAPLQHEERTQVRAALDAADQRVRNAEIGLDAERTRADGFQQELVVARARIAELEADLDRATSPDEAGEADADDAAEFANTPYVVKRGYQGRYSVAKRDGGDVVVGGLSKVDAEAKAREMNGQG